MVAELSEQAPSPEISGMKAVFHAQKAAFSAAPMPAAAERKAHLRALKDAIIADRESLADAVHADFGGRSRHETFAEL